MQRHEEKLKAAQSSIMAYSTIISKKMCSPQCLDCNTQTQINYKTICLSTCPKVLEILIDYNIVGRESYHENKEKTYCPVSVLFVPEHGSFFALAQLVQKLAFSMPLRFRLPRTRPGQTIEKPQDRPKQKNYYNFQRT